MKATNSFKALYHYSKKMKSIDKNISKLDDSLELTIHPHPTIRNHTHSRSQSCPFTKTSPDQQLILEQLQKSQQTNNKSKKKLKKKHRQINSKFTQSTNPTHLPLIDQYSVLSYEQMISNRPSNPETLLADKIKDHQQVILMTKIKQQIKMYELKEDLQKVQKEQHQTNIKQNVLNVLSKKYCHFNQCYELSISSDSLQQ